MRVQCEKCGLVYFDEIKTTICPHPPIGVAPEDYCREHDFIRQYQPEAFGRLGCPSHEKGASDPPGSAGRYLAAAHAMQSGVAIMQNYDDETLPKHLRVGVNSALVDSSSLAKLLISKGLITEAEYLEANAAGMEEEALRYERAVEKKLGRKVTLA